MPFFKAAERAPVPPYAAAGLRYPCEIEGVVPPPLPPSKTYTAAKASDLPGTAMSRRLWNVIIFLVVASHRVSAESESSVSISGVQAAGLVN